MRIPNEFVDTYIKQIGIENVEIVMILMKKCYEYGFEDGRNEANKEFDKLYGE